MTWLLWRQHRLQSALAAAALAAFAIVLAITGITMAGDYHTALTECASRGTDCSQLALFRGDGFIVDLVNITVAVPVLIGAFWGATAIAREYDESTNVLVWTQSVSRRRWVRNKVITVLVIGAVTGALLSLMVTWWSRTENIYHGDRFDPLQFDIQGIVPIGYSLFAVALGLAAGALWRRTLPAIATTIVGYLAARLPIEIWARPNYETPVTRIDTATRSGSAPPQAWQLNSDMLRHHVVVTGPIHVPRGCMAVQTRDEMTRCLVRSGYHLRSTYQPIDRYWTFQWIEFGIFAALAALLAVVAVAVVRHRDA